MTPQSDISYSGVSRHSDDRMSSSEVSFDAQSPNHIRSGQQRMRERDGYGYEPLPRSSKPITIAQTVPLTSEHRNTNDKPIRRTTVRWRISLYTPLSMIGLFISGLLVAIGHHLFYKRFDGTYVRGPGEDGASEYISQVWIIRYGTAFAFIAKTLLAGSTVIAYKQHIWINLRHKSNSVSTIDALFSATHDLLAFLSPSFWTRAKMPAFMALVAWCLPLAALVVPSTLTVHPASSVNIISASVPTLNLNDSSLYSTTFGDGDSPLLRRLTLATATGMQIPSMRRVYPKQNASYRHSFDGPSLKCEEMAGFRLQNMSAIINETTKQILLGAQQYTGNADMRYLSFTTEKYGINTVGFNNVTTFVSDCIINNTCETITTTPILWAKMGNESITCTTYNTNFRAWFGVPDYGAQGDTYPISVISYEHKEPLNTGVTKHIFNALATILNGFFGAFIGGGVGGGFFSGGTMIVTSALLERLQQSYDTLRSVIPQEPWMKSRENQTLAELIEELSRNQTLSLFSSEVLWLPYEDMDKAPVGFWEGHSEYQYLPYNLCMAYSIAIILAFLSVILGLRALYLNGVSHDNSFSSIMAATRNAYLDELTLGHSLGATPMGKEILRTTLKFGVLRQEEGNKEKGESRAGFGIGETVDMLKKGQHIC